MKISQLCIYSGLFIILSSFGNNSLKVISSWLGLTLGAIFLGYGIFKEFKIDRKLNFKLPDSKIKWLNPKYSCKKYSSLGATKKN